ncbi:MAG TPA: endolytic transglycosylase MltG [Paludibacter sp.]|nr:endolytic transglycosylase MltG [Paludibacter sp.]
MKTNSYKKKLFIVVFSLLSGILLIGIGSYYYVFHAPNINQVEDETFLYIRDTDTFDDVLKQIESKAVVTNRFTFIQVARRLKYTHIKPGRYALENKMSNVELIRKLRNAQQDPVKLQFNSLRTKEQLAGRIAEQIMVDSASLITLMNDPEFLKQYEVTPETVISLFIPNTYEVFWNIKAENLFKRMKREYDHFWTSERKAKAAAIPMTQEEVIILASIIQEETNKKSEYPIIAGLYINRLRKKMPLQACPTVKYAVGDFTLQRILHKHLKVDSPYNTYKYPGLPPGPIRTPSTICIDAVLNYEKHDYLYMAADASLNGGHAFAKTGAEHMRNARKIQQVLNEKGIK